MLTVIKILHTLIWAFMAFCVFFVLYSGLTGKTCLFLWIAIGVIIIEGLVLLLNKIACPLTNIAGKYTEDRKANFDIYLPVWLAKHNKLIFTALFIVGLLLVIVQQIK
jgi:hypothetical protein